MANEPYLYGNWGRIGPFTGDPQKRALAEKRWAELQAEMASKKQAELGAMSPAQSVASPAGPPANVGAGPVYNQPITPEVDPNWGYGQDPAIPPSENPNGIMTGAGPLKRLLTGSPWDNIAGGVGPTPAAAGVQYTPGAPNPMDGSEPRTERDQSLKGFTPPAAPPPQMSQEQMMQEQIAKQRQFIDGLFPKRDTSTTAEQAKVDDFAGKEMKRTQLLAQLALASGITSAAGGGWEDVGRGFAAAGSVYGKGFDRYQDALQAGADRAAKLREVQYSDDMTRQEAALNLYQNNSKDQRAAIESRKKQVESMFEKTKPDVGDMGMADEDTRNAYNSWMQRWERYILTGEFEPSNVVDVTK